MSHNKSDAPSNPLMALLAMLGGMDIASMAVVPVKEGQSIEEAIAEHEAAHRAQCPGCAAEYEAEQALQAAAETAELDEKQRSTGMRPEMAAPYGIVAAVVTQRIGESDQFIIQAPPGANLAVGTGMIVAPIETPKRTPIGFMLFDKNDRPLRVTFDIDRKAVETKLKTFSDMPSMKSLQVLAGLAGHDLMAEFTIKPVYA